MNIGDVLAVLHDGEWHSFQEIRERCSLSKQKMEIMLTFLEKYEFIEVHRSTHRARAQERYMDFVKRLRWVIRSEVASATKI